MSRLIERTSDVCTPNPRWTPEQFMQMRIALLTDDHWGAFALQSKHWSFKGLADFNALKTLTDYAESIFQIT